MGQPTRFDCFNMCSCLAPESAGRLPSRLACLPVEAAAVAVAHMSKVLPPFQGGSLVKLSVAAVAGLLAAPSGNGRSILPATSWSKPRLAEVSGFTPA